MGKSSGGGTQTQKTEPWSGQQPFLNFGFNEAQRLYNQGGPDFYPNRTYVPFSQQTEQGLGMLQNRATQGSPVESAMQNYVTNTMQNPGGGGTQDYLSSVMGGDYLNANPYLDGMFNSASRAVTERFNDSVLPGINAAFAGAGGSGSGIHRELALDASDELGQNLTDLASRIYGGNYANERGLQNQAAGMANQLTGIQGDIQRGAAALAPTAANFDYNNIQQLLGVGGAVEGKAGDVLQDSMGRFNYMQQQPYNNLQNYMANIYGNVGSLGGTTTSQGSGNPIAGAAGGALTAGALGGAFPGTLGALAGPWGMLGGAVLGGLLS
jgi:hypothetical protein